MRISEKQTYIDAAGRRVYVASRKKLGTDTYWTYIGYQVDRDGNKMGEGRGWKSDGRDWLGDMYGNIIRSADTGLAVSDECAVILDRLIEAIETDLALPVRVGPKKPGNTGLAFIQTEEEIAALEEEEKWRPHITRQRHLAIDFETERRAKCSRPRITRMEEALGWAGMVSSEEDRRMLIAFAHVKATGREWGQYLGHRNRRCDPKKAWVKRTTYRKIAKTLQEIAIKLRNKEIILRDGAGLPVAHGVAESSCKSITSDLRAAG